MVRCLTFIFIFITKNYHHLGKTTENLPPCKQPLACDILFGLITTEAKTCEILVLVLVLPGSGIFITQWITSG